MQVWNDRKAEVASTPDISTERNIGSWEREEKLRRNVLRGESAEDETTGRK